MRNVMAWAVCEERGAKELVSAAIITIYVFQTISHVVVVIVVVVEHSLSPLNVIEVNAILPMLMPILSTHICVHIFSPIMFSSART